MKDTLSLQVCLQIGGSWIRFLNFSMPRPFIQTEICHKQIIFSEKHSFHELMAKAKVKIAFYQGQNWRQEKYQESKTEGGTQSQGHALQGWCL